MNAGKRTINEIFNGNKVLEIPFFQRAYVWNEDQWERLLSDMVNISELNIPYFLGSVILKQKGTSSNAIVGDVRTVIDGQQRLTTLTVFFKVLLLKNGRNDLFDRIFRLLDNNIALQHNHNDVDDFEKVINMLSLDDLSGKSRIIGVYNYFKKHLDSDKIDYQTILSNIMFVGIDIDNNEDEQQIFDTINSLGVRLTTGELLKNYFFNRDDLVSYEQNWKPIFEKDNECKRYWDKEVAAGRAKHTNLELFFYSFLQIKLQDNNLKVKAEDKNEFGKFEGLFNSYKRFIAKYDIPKSDIIADIKSYAKIYQENIDDEVLKRELPTEGGIERINAVIFGLENSTIIPYILYVLKNVIEEAEKNNIFEYLEGFLMRRIVCKATNKNYNNFFSESLISNNVITTDLLGEHIALQAGRTNYMPDNDELKQCFLDSKLINRQSAGVLYMIETKIRNKSLYSTALSGMSNYSLEHLMPKKWEEKWGKLSSSDATISRNRILLTLGNLAIISSSLNSSISNAKWEIKKDGIRDKAGLLKYAAGIETLHPWLGKIVWDESTIEERGNKLYEYAKNIWKVK